MYLIKSPSLKGQSVGITGGWTGFLITFGSLAFGLGGTITGWGFLITVGSLTGWGFLITGGGLDRSTGLDSFDLLTKVILVSFLVSLTIGFGSTLGSTLG